MIKANQSAEALRLRTEITDICSRFAVLYNIRRPLFHTKLQACTGFITGTCHSMLTIGGRLDCVYNMGFYT